MKIIVTGSLGNISKPLTKDLVAKGHQVTVRTGKLEEHYQRNKPKVLGKVKFTTFAKAFAEAFNQL